MAPREATTDSSDRTAGRRAREIFSAASTVGMFLEFEVALARAQAACGVIPPSAADGIAKAARLQAIDLDAIERATSKTGFPVAPFVRQFTAACGEAGHHVHWGATTQDLLLTTRARQVNEALAGVDAALRHLVAALTDLALRHRDVPMAGRGFGGHALPITFGLKVANWLSPCVRHVHRLSELRARPVEGELGGAMGTLAAMGPQAERIQAMVLGELGLAVPLTSASSARDAVAEALQFLALVTASVAKIAQDVAQLGWTEIAELSEPPSGGRDTSSTLPHKVNPYHSWQAMTSAALVQRNADLMLGAMRQEQERSGHGLLEGRIVPEAFIEAEQCLETMAHVLQGLRVDSARMTRNLHTTAGLITSEAVQMALAHAIGRLPAHDLLHAACETAARDDVPLLDVLAGMPDVTAHLPPSRLRELLEPSNYLGIAQRMVDRAVAAARALN